MTIATNIVYDRLTAIAACLCAEIQDPVHGVPDVCFCGIVPGEVALGQYAGDCAVKCGMAWVRLVSMYPSNIIGVPVEEPGNCGHGLGVDVEIGILRCISVGDEQGNPPPPEEMAAAAELQVADALLMHHAMYCCDAIPNKDMILGQYQPTGPQGGLVGGFYLMSTGIV